MDIKNHAVLVDGSGGRGLLPKRWECPDTSKLVGFAGGLGPETILQQLPLIVDAADGRDYWIDMENRIRDDEDWFCAAKALKVLELI